ncbi:MAG: hypothetical protein ACRD2B_11040 [Terriglobia bacterium]
MALNVTLRWYSVGPAGDRRWRYTRALYAYLAPHTLEVLYIGKADGCSVRDRWREKDDFWRDLGKQRSIFNHGVIGAELEGDFRLTRELLADIESLLIYRIRPWGNIQCQSSKGYSRPDMTVTCSGAWPLRERAFRDS